MALREDSRLSERRAVGSADELAPLLAEVEGQIEGRADARVEMEAAALCCGVREAESDGEEDGVPLPPVGVARSVPSALLVPLPSGEGEKVKAEEAEIEVQGAALCETLGVGEGCGLTLGESLVAADPLCEKEASAVGVGALLRVGEGKAQGEVVAVVVGVGVAEGKGVAVAGVLALPLGEGVPVPVTHAEDERKALLQAVLVTVPLRTAELLVEAEGHAETVAAFPVRVAAAVFETAVDAEPRLLPVPRPLREGCAAVAVGEASLARGEGVEKRGVPVEVAPREGVANPVAVAAALPLRKGEAETDNGAEGDAEGMGEEEHVASAVRVALGLIQFEGEEL